MLFAVSSWYYMQYILAPYQKLEAAATGRPRGNLSDLYPRWLGSLELLVHGRNPYSDEVTQEIQVGYYGRAIDPQRPNDPKDQQGFAYPVYVAFLLAPTLTLPFPVVQKAFHILLVILTAGSAWLWLRALGWRPRCGIIAVFAILTVGSIPAVQGIKLQQLSLLVAGMLAACAAAVASGYLLVAGLLLALATIKPQLAWLAVGWMLVWAVRDWRRRQRLVWAFAVTMLLLLGGAEYLLPGWIGEFRSAVENYHQYTQNMSVLGFLFTPLGGYILACILIALTIIICWPRMRRETTAVDFGRCAALVMALTVVVVPMIAPYNQVLLLPAVLLLARDWNRLLEGSRAVRLVTVVTALLLFWPWIATLGLSISAIFLPPATVQAGWKLPFISNFLLPVFVFALAAFDVAWAGRRESLPGTATA